MEQFNCESGNRLTGGTATFPMTEIMERKMGDTARIQPGSLYYTSVNTVENGIMIKTLPGKLSMIHISCKKNLACHD